MEKILVTGAGGQLGQEIAALVDSFPQFEFIIVGKDELPVQDEARLRAVFSSQLPAYLINCAAYTAVDKAEADKETAWSINAIAPGILAKVCSEFRTKFIHISTDYVFDGDSSVPYKEDDPTGPQGVYGASKLEGEHMVTAENEDAIIIRTAWVYSSFGKNFVKTMLRLMKEKTEIGVVNDQFGSPTYAADLAEGIMHIINSGKWEPGIYHFSNNGVISWYELATAIKEHIQSACKVNPISTVQYPTPAKRPAYSVLDTGKISRTFEMRIKEWEVSLKNCLSLLGK
jgi:dTDP-4-dehydrorhamnose reductase